MLVLIHRNGAGVAECNSTLNKLWCMKTTNNALTLLFAALSFTACTNQSIEPVRSVTPIQSTVQSDSLSPVHILPEKTQQSETPYQYGLETVDQKEENTPYQQPHVITPLPRQTVMPVMKSDTLDQY